MVQAFHGVSLHIERGSTYCSRRSFDTGRVGSRLMSTTSRRASRRSTAAQSLREINISRSGLVIEDFNMTFEVHRKRLGIVAYTPGARCSTEDPHRTAGLCSPGTAMVSRSLADSLRARLLAKPIQRGARNAVDRHGLRGRLSACSASRGAGLSGVGSEFPTVTLGGLLQATPSQSRSPC